MSVLNQSGEEQVECPLCMEPLEVDDLNFYPCTCGYQICRFCWHRIRVDENGLCPACRKAYSENPADFTPLSQQQVLQLKAEKRARDQQRKAKLSESRKHLAAVRVVQKNLVFVVGLPVRLADAEVLKRNEYFGKFGKIHKVVINQSTSYAGSQGPSASAYVTYVKSDDALRAIQSVNNITLDGRLIKSSLGTTKYCSHFMKNQPCPKADCMYLHDFGDPEASFTKEQMHVGKHQEYEKKLHDSLQSRTQQQQQQQSNQSNSIQQQPGTGNSKGDSTTNTGQTGSVSQIATGNGDKPESKERETREREREKERDQREKGDKKNWPTLSGDSSGGFPAKTEKPSTATKPSKKPSKPKPSPPINSSTSVSTQNSHPNSNSLKIDQNIQNSRAKQQCESNSSISGQSTITSCPLQHSPTIELQQQTSQPTMLTSETLENLQKLQILDDNSSFFSNNSFQKCLPEVGDQLPGRNTPEVTRSHILNDNLPDITSSEDWQAAFGFKNDKNLQQNLENSINGLTTPINGLNGHLTQNLDQQMSKFFAEFNKNNFNLQNGFQNQENQLLLMNYQRLENEMMYNLKHNNVYQQPTNNQYLQQQQQQNGHSYQNGLNTEYMNGFNGFQQQHQQQNSVFQNQPLTQQRNLQGLRGDRNSVDDDLGFDPFHETQKALAELIESEQSVQQIQNNGVLGSSSSAPSSSDRGPANSGAPNGLLGGSGAHLPPPPGFVQHNTHMNSFGSKILPFLNMSNNQQISNTNGWSTNNYNEAQIKGVAPVSDWMTLDPAIVSSSRHFPLSHFPLFPHHAHSHAHTHSHNPPMGVQQNHHTNHQNQSSIFDVRQNSSSQGFDVRQQPMFGVGMNGAVVGGSNNGVGVTNLGNINGGVNNLQNLQNLQNLGWFSEFQAVNSPPGFRNKGQEC